MPRRRRRVLPHDGNSGGGTACHSGPDGGGEFWQRQRLRRSIIPDQVFANTTFVDPTTKTTRGRKL
jgi:hypothetical protein